MADDVELVREKIDMVQVINEYTPLTPAGNNFKGLCPLHQEKTPSFYVRPDRQLWYCFGCQKGGDIFSLLMEKENITFPEALKVLAKRAGVTLSGKRDQKATEQKERLLQILSATAAYYQEQLQAKTGKPAQVYLTERGIPEDLVNEFQLGYAPDYWEATKNYLLKKGFAGDDIVAAGLAIESKQGKSGSYDRFRGRVMFPVMDHLGRIVGFSGRILGDQKEAKYINSPETPVFKKGKVLYGFPQAREAALKNQYTILVEGNVDVISLHKAGIRHVVAPLGTGLTTEQLNLLRRISPRVLLAYDMDEAGQKATLRAIHEAVGVGFEVKVVTLTNAKDPDEAVRSNHEQLLHDLRQAQPAFNYFLSTAQKQYPQETPYNKQRIAEMVFSFIDELPEQVVQDSYVQQLGAELNISSQSLQRDFNSWRKNNTRQQQPGTARSESSSQPSSQSVSKTRRERWEEYFLSLLFNVPEALTSRFDFLALVRDIDPHVFQVPIAAHVFEIITNQEAREPLRLTDVIQSLSSDEQKVVDTIVLRDIGALAHDVDLAWQEIQRVRREILSQHYRAVLHQLARQKERAQGEEMEKLNEQIRETTRRLRELQV